MAVPSVSEIRLAVRSSLVANVTRTWQLSRIEWFCPYALSIWLSDCAMRKAADAVARHEGQRRLEEVEAPQRRELVEHQQQLVAARDAVAAIERFGGAADLVEDQADERLRPLMSEGGTTRYSDTGCSAAIRSAMRQSQRDVTSATVGSRYRPRNDMAVDSTPDALVVRFVEHFARSRMRPRDAEAIAEVRRGHHPVQRQLEWAGRVGEEVGDAAQRLVLARIEHMQDGADQQRVRSLLPVVALLQRAFGIDQNVRDVLHVAHFARRPPHLQQREQAADFASVGLNSRHVREARAPAGGDLPVLALDVVDDGG